MPKLIFYPIGNGDCTLINLADGQKILIDYADLRNPDDPQDKRIDLPSAVRADLGARTAFDTVAFTHLDSDHICGATNFFYLEHAAKYQDNSNGKRIGINEMWVPASVIVEEQCDNEARILQAEARYRFITLKDRIRVISRPDRLNDWLKQKEVAWASVQHLVCDAGTCIPTFDQAKHGVEFFIHAPFAGHVDAGTTVDRNCCSLVMQAAFLAGGKQTRVLMCGDVDDQTLADIVKSTRYHGHADRLGWEAIKVSHHSSYKPLNQQDKGKDVTDPLPEVKWLFEQGATSGIIISTSKPIPTNDDDVQPPHRQAANYYRGRAKSILGKYEVTMEHPTTVKPEPLVINIDGRGACLDPRSPLGSAAIVSRPGPRMG